MSVKVDLQKLNEAKYNIQPLFDLLTSIVEANTFMLLGKTLLAEKRLDLAEYYLELAKYRKKIHIATINVLEDILKELRKALGQFDVWYYSFVRYYTEIINVILVAYLKLIQGEEEK